MCLDLQPKGAKYEQTTGDDVPDEKTSSSEKRNSYDRICTFSAP